MSSKKESVIVDINSQEKETSMRFDRNFVTIQGKRGILAQLEKKAKSLPLLMTEEEQKRHDAIMAPKRMRRKEHREMKRREAQRLEAQRLAAQAASPSAAQ